MAITRITAPSITGLVIPNTSINNASLDSVTALPSGVDVGKVLQIVTDTKTDTFSSSSTSFTNITGLSASITPSAITSKVLIILYLGTVGMANYTQLSINDGSSDLATSSAYGDGGNAQTDNVSLHHLDSPSTTSAITYSAKMRTKSGTAYINRNGANDSYGLSTSSITLIEIGA